jgi:hypothetical protein
MSRHEIPARDPAHKVIVGWDPPLQTFFAQVIDRNKEAAGKDDKFVLWIGCGLREITEIETLAKKIARYAVLTRDMVATLYGDKDEGR